MFETILIANRGEIAVRIARCARELGIRTIALYSDADRGALWTRLADEAVHLGPASSCQGYRDVDRIVDIALAHRADAIHPGYGFLSESAVFAEAACRAGIAYIGPRPETLQLMGDKLAARRAAMACGIPVLAGSERAIASLDEALACAEVIGWPVVVKGVCSGGGRGLRIASDRTTLVRALEQAGCEAAAVSGCGDVFLEHCLPHARHIEVQVLGDRFGALVHLGDRDCSVQRRHQKLMEEAPAPGLADVLRDRLWNAATALCASLRYENAGTVEFLVDVAAGRFYFLEMNPRLQVEHGVTELVTGIDLVQQQIRVAAGERLGFRQEEVRITGHAIQARIAAEVVATEFRPCSGVLGSLRLPQGPWLRADFGVEAGDAIPREYDSMFGKLLAWGRSRDEARRRLRAALDALDIVGVPSTASYLRELLDKPDYVAARHDTASVETAWRPAPAPPPASPRAARSLPHAAHRSARRVRIPWGEGETEVEIQGVEAGRRRGVEASGRVAPDSAKLPVRATIADVPTIADGPAVVAPMDAVVVSVNVVPGDRVDRGATLLVLEAMKLAIIVVAPHAGRVERLTVKAGDAVRQGMEVVRVAP